jgi:hypothetical protein
VAVLLLLAFGVGTLGRGLGLGLSGREFGCGENDLSGLGVGSLSSMLWSPSCPGRGGGASRDGRRLLCLDEPKDDFRGLDSGMPKRVCNFLRVEEALGVSGLDGERWRLASLDASGIAIAEGGRFFARGVPGVMVVFVAVVVEERGRDWRRVAGLEGVIWSVLSFLARPF